MKMALVSGRGTFRIYYKEERTSVSLRTYQKLRQQEVVCMCVFILSTFPVSFLSTTTAIVNQNRRTNPPTNPPASSVVRNGSSLALRRGE